MRLQTFADADCGETQVQRSNLEGACSSTRDRTEAQGWGLKAESALCEGEDCSLAFTREKGDYVTSVHHKHDVM